MQGKPPARSGKLRIGAHRQDRKGKHRVGKHWQDWRGVAGFNLTTKGKHMAQYTWKPGAGPKPGVDAQIFGDTIEKLAGLSGSAKPEDIVNEARSRKSPIHGAFTWDDTEAAELYRRDEARHLIGALQIVRVQFSEGPTVSNRAFYSVVQKDRRGYVPHEKIMSDADLRQQVLADARKELESFIRKFGSVMALGTFGPRLQEILDDMRDGADVAVTDASKRLAGKKVKENEDQRPAVTG